MFLSWPISRHSPHWSPLGETPAEMSSVLYLSVSTVNSVNRLVEVREDFFSAASVLTYPGMSLDDDVLAVFVPRRTGPVSHKASQQEIPRL